MNISCYIANAAKEELQFRTKSPGLWPKSLQDSLAEEASTQTTFSLTTIASLKNIDLQLMVSKLHWLTPCSLSDSELH